MVSEGDLIGSMNINHGFRQYLETHLGEASFSRLAAAEDGKVINGIMHHFDLNIKPLFSSPIEWDELRVPDTVKGIKIPDGILPDTRDGFVRNNTLRLSG